VKSRNSSQKERVNKKQHGIGAKTRDIDQWNRMKDPELSPCCCSDLTINKGTKNMLEKRYHLQQLVLKKLDIYM
jgi:hypothetical protein